MTSDAAEAAPAAAVTADLERIKRAIPHRYPMLMIDRVEGIERGKRAVGVKNISVSEPLLQGHFPTKPIMPGVLIVEAMAQTAGVLVIETLDEFDNDYLVYFMTVDKARFRRLVEPGDVLRLHVEIQRNRGKVWKFWGEAHTDAGLAAEAEFAAMIVDQAAQAKKGGG